MLADNACDSNALRRLIAEMAASAFVPSNRIRKIIGFKDEQLRPCTFTPAVFLSDLKLVQQGYVTSDALHLGSRLEKRPVIMRLADYGYANYATTVFGLRSFSESKPQVVRHFWTPRQRAMTDERWKAFFTDMSAPGVCPAGLDYKQAHTLRFVDKK